MTRPALKKRRWGWIIWLVAIAVGGWFARRWWKNRSRGAGIAVRVHRVQRGVVRELVSTSGTGRVAAERELTLRAEIAARVSDRLVRRGGTVKKGDVLIRFDTTELMDRLHVSEAAVALARAQLAQAEASGRLARSNATRAGHLATQGVTPIAEAETLQGQALVALRGEASARAAIQQGLANVQIARTTLERAEVKAPFDAVVLSTNVEVGESVAPGAPMLALAETSALHVDGEIDEADLGRVKEGAVAEVSLDAFPTDRFPGVLREIAPSVTRDLRGNRAVPIRVELRPDTRLRVGMSADVDLVVSRREGVLWLPPNAVMGRGTDRAVYVVDNGVARRRSIGIGVSTWEAVEVTSGVAENDQVIVTLSDPALEDGAAVRVSGEEKEAGHREGAP